MRKEIVCDSSALISLTDCCMLRSLAFITKKFNFSFIITDVVEYECITNPLKITTKEYNLSALRIQDALKNNELIKVKSSPETIKKRDEILTLANNLFFAQGRPLTLLHAGEAEIIALAYELNIKHLLMDERTTRLLIEAPFRVKEHFEEEFRINIMVNRDNLTKFNDIVKGFEISRSSEFVSLAYSAGYFNEYGTNKKDIYVAALYKLKYSGCSIRFNEIEELARTS